MSISIIKNQPVGFGYDLNGSDEDCNCKGQPFCQIVEQADTTGFQFQIEPAGVDLVYNGDFSLPGGWTLGANWTISGGKITHTPGSTAGFSQTTTYPDGRYFREPRCTSGCMC